MAYQQVNSGIEYLEKTRSAVESLLSGIDKYLDVLRSSPPPVYISNSPIVLSPLPSVMRRSNLAEQASMNAQSRFVSEAFAMANLSGALLQIAACGIRMFSRNERISSDLAILGVGAAQSVYCVGRKVRDVPLGLIIYAARNQYNHIDDDELRPVNVAIFDRLATAHGLMEAGQVIRDPAYDLANPGRPICLANNVTALIDWREYGIYQADMKHMMSLDTQ